MGFPEVIVECAFNSLLPESTSAPTGFTEITKYVDSISGTLRGRSYELDDVETGSITLALDNSDGRFTPGSSNSPYYPYVKANRRIRIRGKNLHRPNVARAGGAENSTEGFFRGSLNVLDVSDGVTMRVTEPVLVTHNPVTLGFTGDLLKETTHIEATLKAGATAGTYRVLSWYVPVELGTRLAHRYNIWRVSGTEPASTVMKTNITYFDADGTILAKPDNDFVVSWNTPTPTTPTAGAGSLTDLPNGDTAYAIQSVYITLASTATTDLTYAVAGLQAEVPTTNLTPGISGWYDAQAFSLDGSGVISKGGGGSGSAYLIGTWAADDTELVITVPHLVPGDDYTFAIEAQKSGGPSVLLSADDGLTGATLSSNTTWTTLRTTFTATRPEQDIKFIPQGTVVAGQTLWLRLARCGPADPALALSGWAGDSEVTAWARPIPVFDGWVERWPVKTTASGSTISITVNDRLKKLGEIAMESTLKTQLITDAPDLLMPMNDDPADAQGKLSISGDWADAAGTSQVTPSPTKYGAGVATITFGGSTGPTDEDAILIDQASLTQGYAIVLPYSKDFVIPTPPPAVTPKPVPKPPVKRTYKKTYYATWSRSYDGSGNPRWNDPSEVYQGDVSDSNGNQKSLIGFNWNAINADLRGASVLGATISLFAIHWWYYAGGTLYLGTHTNTSKPGTFINATERRWRQSKWPRNAWRTINIGAAGGVLFQKGTAKGVVVGRGNNDEHETYGYLAGATMKQRPYITITYKK